MGIGALRRHYEVEEAAPEVAPSDPQPVVEQTVEGQRIAEHEQGDAEVVEVDEDAGEALPEPPARSAKTAAWVEYAEANPTDPPIDLTERKGLRDEIAAHYLGEG